MPARHSPPCGHLGVACHAWRMISFTWSQNAIAAIGEGGGSRCEQASGPSSATPAQSSAKLQARHILGGFPDRRPPTAVSFCERRTSQLCRVTNANRRTLPGGAECQRPHGVCMDADTVAPPSAIDPKQHCPAPSRDLMVLRPEAELGPRQQLLVPMGMLATRLGM